MICADHLNTRRLVADAAGTTVWKWDQQEPFGNNVPDENPTGLGAFDLPLRLPGQYFDKETNLHYNYYRDYDPSIGRYGESDPIGLSGGLNTYAYVLGNPLAKTDAFGLAAAGGTQLALGTLFRDPVEAARREGQAAGIVCASSRPNGDWLVRLSLSFLSSFIWSGGICKLTIFTPRVLRLA
jgi:RHS repeat-associated protein